MGGVGGGGRVWGGCPCVEVPQCGSIHVLQRCGPLENLLPMEWDGEGIQGGERQVAVVGVDTQGTQFAIAVAIHLGGGWGESGKRQGRVFGEEEWLLEQSTSDCLGQYHGRVERCFGKKGGRDVDR